MDIEVYRKKEFMGMAGKIDLYVNGEQLTKIKRDQAYSFQVNSSAVLQAKSSRLRSNLLEINLEEEFVFVELTHNRLYSWTWFSGGILTIFGILGSGTNLPLLIIGLLLLISSMVFEKNAYILKVITDL